MKQLIVLAFAVVAVAACSGQATSTGAGHSAASASASASASANASRASAQPSTGPSRDVALPVNLCSVLHWSDLGYPGIAPGAPSPTESNRLSGWDQSCFWASQQFDAGYVPPHSAQCDNGSVSSSSSLQCVGVDAKEYASIEAHSQWVKLTVAWRGVPTRVSPVSYVQDGTPVYLNDDAAHFNCSGGLEWGGGTLVVLNQDATKAFGSPCAEVKKVVALLIKRQPRG
jgi:hypothetical protein